MTFWPIDRKVAERAHTGSFLVVHPLDDLREEKFGVGLTNRMQLTRLAKLVLVALRGYLMLMAMLLVYRLFEVVSASR